MNIFKAIEQKEKAEEKIEEVNKLVAKVLRTSENSIRIKVQGVGVKISATIPPSGIYSHKTFEKLGEIFEKENWSFKINKQAMRILLTPKMEEEDEKTLSESENS